MADRDGNGWVECTCGSRHWGRHGAAGLFLEVEGFVLLQLRPLWAHLGGTWSIPGGARDSHETPVDAALREAHEETALDVVAVRVDGIHRVAHRDWHYDTVLARADHRPEVHEHAESVELTWVARSDVAGLDLHPGLAASLPALLAPRIDLVVDVANVVGSRPDGWWRDRVGATQAVLGECEKVVGTKVELDGRAVLCQSLTAVVEGPARAVSPRALTDLVRVVDAPGSGDDTIAAVAAERPASVVVTADRGLRARVPRAVGVSQLWRWTQ